MRDFLDGWLEGLGARLIGDGLRPGDARWEAFWDVVRAVGALEKVLETRAACEMRSDADDLD